uniref:acyl-CoA thioesterase n=1 Tax=Parerythrobacter lutipelagi TaxID=1964208 RepID=UPI0010F9263D|nr:thioesterase family protein [Parerythrobacter lutipelagi]
MSARQLIEPIEARLGRTMLPEAENWMQGRTLYGGASAFIAYTAALRAFPELPPLRAAQIGFVAPVGSEIELSAEIVRQGRNVAQVRSEIRSGGTVALTAFWLFGTEREPNAAHPASEIDDWPGKAQDAEPVAVGKGPSFLRENFELRRAQDERGPGQPVVRRWLRLIDRSGLDPVSEMILLGDTLPPGAMRAMQRQGPISSINWSFNLLDPAPDTNEGWWLAETASEWADLGYSSERLRLWNSDGRQMLSGLQSVAIFG